MNFCCFFSPTVISLSYISCCLHWVLGNFFGQSFTSRDNFFMSPIMRCRGHYVMAYASVSVNIWFPSIIGQTPGSIDPIWLPSWIWFPSIRGQTTGSIDQTLQQITLPHIWSISSCCFSFKLKKA
jgi:hypothetical protein